MSSEPPSFQAIAHKAPGLDPVGSDCLIAPVMFPESPFFFEVGMQMSVVSDTMF